MYNPILKLNSTAKQGFHQGSYTRDSARIWKQSLFDVPLFRVVQMSSFVSEVLSKHKAINYIGSHITPNANLPYKRRTFDRADCGVVYTNTPLQNVSIYLKPSSACCWCKKKSNITHARRYSRMQPIRLDIAGATIAQWGMIGWSAAELNKY